MKVFTKCVTTLVSWRVAIQVIVIFVAVVRGSAQSTVWTDTFTQFQAPTTDQINNWTIFLNQLVPSNYYVSAKITGTFDSTGIAITDPVAAHQLANLLYTRSVGSVTSDGHTWNVGVCGGLELSVDGPICDCSANYSIRVFVGGYQWGGVNSATCSPPSQTMKLEFEHGAIITPSGPTIFCQGGSVTLTASSSQCTSPYTYLWSTGETTSSIVATQSGDYSVVISSANGCTSFSSINVNVEANPIVSVGNDVTACDPVQLNASVINNGGNAAFVTKVCLFDAPDADGNTNCTFTGGDLCTDGYQFIYNSQFSQSISIPFIPAGINFKLYYTPCTQSTNFTFKLNGNVIGSFLETVYSCTCDPSGYDQYPKTISFDPSQFLQFWTPNADNSLSIEIISDDSGVGVAGITAEVFATVETYSWAPSIGLSDATISNPIANPNVSTIYTLNYTNSNGCSATSQVQVHIDDVAPTAAAKNVTIQLDVNGVASITAADVDDGSTDNCRIASYTLDNTNFNCSNVGSSTLGPPGDPGPPGPPGPPSAGDDDDEPVSNIVTLTVTDVNGNSASATAIVTVLDNIPPTVSTKNIILSLSADGAATITAIDIDNGSSDNCSIASYSASKTSFDCSNVGDNLVTLTATDGSGNSASASAIVTIQGLGGIKVQMCHKTGSSKNPCTTICVDELAVAVHLAQGDILGKCDNSCSSTIANARVTSDESPIQKNEIAVETYPNPFRSSVYIQISNPENELVSMNMVDLMGRYVTLRQSYNTEIGIHVLDTDQLSGGMYFLQVKIGDYSKTVKLVKE